MKWTKAGFLLGGLLYLFMACQTEPEVAVESAASYPDHIGPPHYAEAILKRDTALYSLGKSLFFDPILSVNGTVSCGSCHKPEFAFSDGGQATSLGIHGRVGVRNTPPLFNLAWMKSFMADGGINHLELVPVAAMTNPLEMGERFIDVNHRLNASTYYRARFAQVFESDSIEDIHLLKALAHYVGYLQSFNSKFDRVQSGQAKFAPMESRGYGLFNRNCASCHAEPHFTDHSFRNVGLYLTYADSGRARITQNPEDRGKFKVPSLRNLSFTAPYMHDGSLATLEEVIDFYSDDIQAHPQLDPEIKLNLGLSADEKSDLLAFLKTLNDSDFIRRAEYLPPNYKQHTTAQLTESEP